MLSYIGFTILGNVVNKPEHGSLDWVKICERSSKVITFIDLAGHERYLKTTVFGMTGHAPDFGMLMVRKKLASALRGYYILLIIDQIAASLVLRCEMSISSSESSISN